jgi:hypothetical protein
MAVSKAKRLVAASVIDALAYALRDGTVAPHIVAAVRSLASGEVAHAESALSSAAAALRMPGR